MSGSSCLSGSCEVNKRGNKKPNESGKFKINYKYTSYSFKLFSFNFVALFFHK